MEKIQWQISVPIFRNTVILKQLWIAIGIPFGLVALVIGLASGKSVYALYGLGLIAALLFSPGFSSWRSIGENMRQNLFWTTRAYSAARRQNRQKRTESQMS